MQVPENFFGILILGTEQGLNRKTRRLQEPGASAGFFGSSFPFSPHSNHWCSHLYQSLSCFLFCSRECCSRLAGGLVVVGGVDGAPGGGDNDHLRRPAAGVHGEAILRHVPDEARRHPLLPRRPPLRHGLLWPGTQ